jgi:chromosome segregation ATPase
MATISGILSLSDTKAETNETETPAPIQPADDPSAYNDSLSSLKTSARVGGDNELLRTILADTSSQIGVVDDLSASFRELITPLSALLRALEEEKAGSVRTKGALGALRVTHDAMVADSQQLEKRHSELQAENGQLCQKLEAALTQVRDLEAGNGKLYSDIAGERAAMATVESQLNEEISSAGALSEENKTLADRAEALEQKAAALEIKASGARQSLSALENERANLEPVLDRALVESSLLSRQLTESEKVLSDARTKLAQMKRRVGAMEAQRIKVAAACAMATERMQNETQALSAKVDALQSHADGVDKLLITTRQSLFSRAEDMRLVEAKLFEAESSRNKAERTLEKSAAVAEGWEQQVEKLQQTNTELADKCRATTETLATSEGWLVHAKEKIKSLTAEIEALQADTAAGRAKFDEDVVQLNATSEHERCERSLAEGALQTVRRDYARLQAQMAQERALRR